MNPLDTVHAALDAAPARVHFLLRDDDGGRDDARLFALLDCTERAGVPIDVAMIPCATTDALAASLVMRMRATPGLVGVHQHGFAHANHETVERKCEFGAARSLPAQRDDLVAGRERLRELFVARLDPIFTPPWNRCSAGTPALLAELGYAALSRDRGASAQRALPELAVDLDWSKQLRLAAQHAESDALPRIAHELARCIADHGARSPVGVMLHHADMQPEHLAQLEALLNGVKAHSRARWLPMREFAPGA
jgi:predicted deacetylase